MRPYGTSAPPWLAFRKADGGTNITGAHVAPENPAWTDSFKRMQEQGRVVFSAAIDGAVYARHGTSIDTRLTVIDRVPAEDVGIFVASTGIAPDLPTLLAWARTTCRHVGQLPALRLRRCQQFAGAPAPPTVRAYIGQRQAAMVPAIDS